MVVLKSARLTSAPNWTASNPGLVCSPLIQVESERQFKKGGQLRVETETRYYIASFVESAEQFARRIGGYWGVENKVHYVRIGHPRRGSFSNSDARSTSDLRGCT